MNWYLRKQECSSNVTLPPLSLGNTSAHAAPNDHNFPRITIPSIAIAEFKYPDRSISTWPKSRSSTAKCMTRNQVTGLKAWTHLR